ncbi:excisionase [Paracidovorax citrulli]|jgi:hypothetical protein|uniref:Excisionase n=2 Tax=Paracidovorax citrulli TaxID=80869 RepID=A1TPL4_PARC0|nr:hypothetical protein [Paracidovorax citrulli]ABM32902.1 hypothetical protein Aave_2326 [Paracidovorax citrulli AAC00-1]ATG93130.1 excisionase [Paracidovorax citrulli]MVT36812.1 excisionase [Paracidovorax citrulli]PVY67119.1 hypothetical protein C8E08_4553 [Paracidovorax citrulli]REG68718.1 hypothetical protein C8E07_1838 [Paracidovorax citrulli]
MARFIRIPKFCLDTGYTDRAVETKIHRGVWVEGKEYVRAPDGNVLIDMEGYNRWAAKHHPEVLDHAATA